MPFEEDYWKKRIGEYLRARREACGKSQSEIQAMSRAWVSDVELGRANPTIDTLLRYLQEVGGDLAEAVGPAPPVSLSGVLFGHLVRRMLELAPQLSREDARHIDLVLDTIEQQIAERPKRPTSAPKKAPK